jgi:peptidoglycan/xylan/chitin deacetylase (PgdA/CDA1 family)
MNLRHQAFSAVFAAISATRIDRWGRGLAQGAGVILTLHHVRPPDAGGFRPNGILEITPDFLDHTLTLIRAEGYDLVSLDEALVRLSAPRKGRFFVALTFDDGYRDNVEHAWPVLAKHGAPWTLFVTPGFADRTARLWWLELEEAIRALPTGSTGVCANSRKRFCWLRFQISRAGSGSMPLRSQSANACPGRRCARWWEHPP